MKVSVRKLFKASGVLASLGLFAIGSYNTFQVNIDSFMLDNEIKFVKRLDELNGMRTNGRIVAHNGNWKSLVKEKKAVKRVFSNPIENKVTTAKAAPKKFKAEPAIKEELNLNLSNVFHPKKDLKGKKVSGNLQAYYGIIDAIDFNIEGVASVSLSKVGKLTGNIFEYTFGDEVYTAMLYEQDKSTYMVTLTTGPKELQGLRLQFKNEDAVISNLAQNDFEDDTEEFAQNLNDTKENFDKGDYQDEESKVEENSDVEPVSYGFNFSS